MNDDIVEMDDDEMDGDDIKTLHMNVYDNVIYMISELVIYDADNSLEICQLLQQVARKLHVMIDIRVTRANWHVDNKKELEATFLKHSLN